MTQLVPAVVMMGVSGSGKTTVGSALAKRLGVPFRDADGFHPKANVEKMSAGIPLTDEDRWPWLDAIAAAIRDTPASEGIVVSCSALRKIYRERIVRAAGRKVTFVHLDGTKQMIGPRMATRTGHFMPLSLLDSQLATLEPLASDEPGFRISIEDSPDRIVEAIVEHLRRGS
jgi:gluconokinase